MNCKDADELMSLKIDGLLGTEGERDLGFHMENCAGCKPRWEAMQEADNLITKWVSEPVVVPSGFHSKVMMRIAALPVQRPMYDQAAAIKHITGPVQASEGTGTSHSAPLFQQGTRPLTGALPTQLTEYLRTWQAPIAAWARRVAIASVSLFGTLGLVLLLLATRVITLDGPLADVTRALQTALQAAGTWASSVFGYVGAEVWVAFASIVGLLVLIGWQVVAGYQRSAVEQRGNTGRLEATS